MTGSNALCVGTELTRTRWALRHVPFARRFLILLPEEAPRWRTVSVTRDTQAPSPSIAQHVQKESIRTNRVQVNAHPARCSPAT